MSLMTILEKDIETLEEEPELERVESIDVDPTPDFKESPKPSETKQLPIKTSPGLFSNLMKPSLRRRKVEGDKEGAGASLSDTEDDERSELFKVILPLSKSQKSLYSPDSMMLYFYLEKYLISLI